MGRGRKSNDCERAQMGIAQARLQTAGERLIGQQRVEMHGRLRDAHALSFGRDSRMQIGEGCGVVEPIGFGHEAFEELQHPVGAIDEAAQQLVGIDAVVRPSLIEPVLRA